MLAHAQRLTQSKFARNVAIVASGTAGAQAITLAFTPIITRLYSPEAFGVLGTFTSILVVLAPVAALSYPIAIVLPKRDVDAVGLAELSIGIAVAMSLLVSLILMLFKAPIVNTFNLQAVEPFILLLPLAMLFSAAMAVMSQWVIRKKLFKLKAKVAVLQALWINSAKAGIGLFSPLSAVLIVLATLGSALHALMLWAAVRKSSDGQMEVAKQSKDTDSPGRALAWRHRDFAYYRTPQIMLNAASESMPVLMLASFFGPAAAGFYALAKMALVVPSQLIGQSVADVFYPKFVETLHDGKNGKSIILKACISLLVIGVFPYLIIVFTGPVMFSFIFGSTWEMSGSYSQWMAVWLLVVMVSRPIISTIPVLGLQKQFLIFEVLALAIRGAAIFIGYAFFASAISAVAFFSLANVAIYVFLTVYVISRT
ncbi:oligosaccharide flippase family protein [Halomonas sp. TRM85114]|uniref:oligosaccharide flippase family protein n=1 Tax=Halomonas jincaotanensis TaxID=2810616 RepID=UPI001BD35EB5|nr:oligosaccharide flippase family protein [Halomonas jincaotanensis]MBS9404060.1 oligosaccharide flippase family protein [Halomonas jincaotanensis]